MCCVSGDVATSAIHMDGEKPGTLLDGVGHPWTSPKWLHQEAMTGTQVMIDSLLHKAFEVVWRQPRWPSRV